MYLGDAVQEAIRDLIAEGFPVQQALLELQTAVLAEVSPVTVSHMSSVIQPYSHLEMSRCCRR